MGFVIMGDTLNIAEPDGQHRSGAFQRLDLALFIRRRKRVPVRWIEIRADNAAQLLDEKGIGGNLESCGSYATAGRRAETVNARSSWKVRSRQPWSARPNGLLPRVCLRASC